MNCGVSIHIYCCTLSQESGPKKQKKERNKNSTYHLACKVNPHYIMATELARGRLKNMLLSLCIKYIKGEISRRDWTHHNIMCRLNLWLEIICTWGQQVCACLCVWSLCSSEHSGTCSSLFKVVPPESPMLTHLLVCSLNSSFCRTVLPPFPHRLHYPAARITIYSTSSRPAPLGTSAYLWRL